MSDATQVRLEVQRGGRRRPLGWPWATAVLGQSWSAQVLSALHETDDRTPRRTRRRATLTCEIHKHFQLFADDMVGARRDLRHLTQIVRAKRTRERSWKRRTRPGVYLRKPRRSPTRHLAGAGVTRRLCRRGVGSGSDGAARASVLSFPAWRRRLAPLCLMRLRRRWPNSNVRVPTHAGDCATRSMTSARRPRRAERTR